MGVIMLKDLNEIKKFIEWCKKNKVKTFKNGNIEFELSELSFVPQLDDSQMDKKITEAYDETLVDTAKQELDKEDEQMLYWSTQS